MLSIEFLNAIPAPLCVCDAHGRITLLNDAAVELWGRTPRMGYDVRDDSCDVPMPDGDAPPLDFHPVAQAMQGNASESVQEIVIERPDGSRRMVQLHPRPLRDATGAVIGALVMLVDVTDRRESELQLAQVRKGLARQVEALTRLHELSVRLARTADLIPALQSILQTLVELHEADFGLVAVYDRVTGFLRTGASIGFDARALQQVSEMKPGLYAGVCGRTFALRGRVAVADVHTDPASKPNLAMAECAGFRAIHCTPILSRSGEALGVLSVYFKQPRLPTEGEQLLADMCATHAADAIETTRFQQALRESELRFRRMANNAPAIIWTASPDGTVTWFSDRWFEYTGLSRADHARAWPDVVHPDDVERCLAFWSSAFREGSDYQIEMRMRRHDGPYRWFLTRAEPIRDAAGTISCWFGSTTDIQDQKAIEEDLQKAKEAAEAANMAKDHFLAVLSHELRTPLTPVLMAASAMELDGSLPGDVRENAEMIRRNVELETRLIDDLLDLSRITSGKLRLEPQDVDVNAAVRHVNEICHPQMLNRALRTSIEVDPGAGLIKADPARLQQVLWNLLSNAAKFTPEGGEVHISTHSTSRGTVRIEIRDTGIGIAEEDLARVFDAFQQEHSRPTRPFGGLGLGLAISKAIVELHHGTIQAASPGRGQGATFSIELPALDASLAIRTPPPHQARPPRRTALRLLIVEDHADTSRILRKLLQGMGYSIQLASTAADARKHLSRMSFDIMISDIDLPDATGYELMRSVRDHPAMVGIAMSGFGMDNDIRLSLEAGFREHLVKPVDVRRLEEVITRLSRERV